MVDHRRRCDSSWRRLNVAEMRWTADAAADAGVDVAWVGAPESLLTLFK